MPTLTFPAVLENLDQMIDFIIAESVKVHFDQKLQNKLRLAAEEVLVNVISYAYPDGGGDVSIVAEPTSGREGIRIQVIDAGVPFNPLDKPAPDLDVPVAERKIGGLGIYLVREIMNDVSYRYEDGKNIMTFVKYRE